MTARAIRAEIANRINYLEDRSKKLFLLERATNDANKLCTIHRNQTETMNETCVLRRMLEAYERYGG